MEYSYIIQNTENPDFSFDVLAQRIKNELEEENPDIVLRGKEISIITRNKLLLDKENSLQTKMSNADIGKKPVGTTIILGKNVFQIAQLATKTTLVQSYIMGSDSFKIVFEDKISQEQVDSFFESLKKNSIIQ